MGESSHALWHSLGMVLRPPLFGMVLFHPDKLVKEVGLTLCTEQLVTDTGGVSSMVPRGQRGGWRDTQGGTLRPG